MGDYEQQDDYDEDDGYDEHGSGETYDDDYDQPQNTMNASARVGGNIYYRTPPVAPMYGNTTTGKSGLTYPH